MSRKINLVVKSEKQYNKAIKKLEAIGAVGFYLTGYNPDRVGSDDYGIGYFQESNKFTDGVPVLVMVGKTTIQLNPLLRKL